VWWVSYCDQIVERMLVYAEDGQTIVPTCSGWEVSDDGGLDVHVRKGMKWSDGEPITSEDVRFWWKIIKRMRHQLNPVVAVRFGRET
jgi:ABC-type transport system substrate-binding protein